MKRILCFLLACSLLLACLAGCSEKKADTAAETSAPTEVTAFTAPDGNPEDVTCKGDYSGEPDATQVVARCGSGALTLGTLQSLYALEVLGYLGGDNSILPDPSLPFSQQECNIDNSAATWQQYFLGKALSTWHRAQALSVAAEVEGLPVEEAFQPNLDNYAEYMTGMPATKYMYRYESGYSPNTMHQAFLDNLEDTAFPAGKNRRFCRRRGSGCSGTAHYQGRPAGGRQALQLRLYVPDHHGGLPGPHRRGSRQLLSGISKSPLCNRPVRRYPPHSLRCKFRCRRG